MKVYLKFASIMYLSVSLIFYISNTAYSQSFSIGQKYKGGIIFYVDSTGLHGLIAASSDQGKTLGKKAKLNWNGDGVNPKLNPYTLYPSQVHLDDATTAESICNYYSITFKNITYSNWYLPSKYELNLLYEQKSVVGGFTNDLYWSSTMNENGGLWLLDFSSGKRYSVGRYCIGFIRPIQTF